MSDRIPTVKLTPEEWDAVGDALMATPVFSGLVIPEILIDVLGAEKTDTLLVKREDPKLSDAQVWSLVKAVWERIPAQTDNDKRAWLEKTLQPAFESDERFAEIIRYVDSRLQEHLNAGGRMDGPAPSTLSAKDNLDPSTFTWFSKPHENGKDFKEVAQIKFHTYGGDWVRLEMTPEIPGELNCCFFVWREIGGVGQWVGGGWDATKGKVFNKTIKNLPHGGYPARYAPKGLTNVKKGEDVVYVVINAKDRVRTNGVLVPDFPRG